MLIIATRKGADGVLNGKIKLGANVAAAASPASAHVASYSAENSKIDILIYTRAKAPVAGVSLKGASMDSDEGANKAIYGKDEGALYIIQDDPAIVPAAKPLVELLDKASPIRK